MDCAFDRINNKITGVNSFFVLFCITFHPFNTAKYGFHSCHQFFNAEDLSITGPGLLLAFEYGVRDWRGILDKDGKEMKFSKSNISKVPPVALAQTGGRIIRMSSMTEEDLGNS